MPMKSDKKADSEHLHQLQKAQDERIEEMFEELRDYNIDLLSQTPRKCR